MMSKLNRVKATLVALCCGGIPLITEVQCYPNGGGYFFRDDDSGDYYDDYYYDDYYYDDYYYDYYCDPYYCY